MLSRLIYSSTSLCDAAEGLRLCIAARPANSASQITGALYLSDNTFFQYLEGDEMQVAGLVNRIRQDKRHTNCQVLDNRLISLRIFKLWPMAWLPRTAQTDLVMQAVVPPGSDAAAIDGTTAGTLFLALSQSAERR
jgi:hypothetical protein